MWQQLRGKSPTTAVESHFTNETSGRGSGYIVYGWWLLMVVWSTPLYVHSTKSNNSNDVAGRPVYLTDHTAQQSSMVGVGRLPC